MTCRELTLQGAFHEETHPCHTFQTCAMQLDGLASIIVDTASEGQALEVRAALDEIGVDVVDHHLADFRKHGTFEFELGRNRGPVADAQQFQPCEVWQPK